MKEKIHNSQATATLWEKRCFCSLERSLETGGLNVGIYSLVVFLFAITDHFGCQVTEWWKTGGTGNEYAATSFK